MGDGSKMFHSGVWLNYSTLTDHVSWAMSGHERQILIGHKSLAVIAQNHLISLEMVKIVDFCLFSLVPDDPCICLQNIEKNCALPPNIH